MPKKLLSPSNSHMSALQATGHKGIQMTHFGHKSTPNQDLAAKKLWQHKSTQAKGVFHSMLRYLTPYSPHPCYSNMGGNQAQLVGSG